MSSFIQTFSFGALTGERGTRPGFENGMFAYDESSAELFDVEYEDVEVPEVPVPQATAPHLADSPSEHQLHQYGEISDAVQLEKKDWELRATMQHEGKYWAGEEIAIGGTYESTPENEAAVTAILDRMKDLAQTLRSVEKDRRIYNKLTEGKSQNYMREDVFFVHQRLTKYLVDCSALRPDQMESLIWGGKGRADLRPQDLERLLGLIYSIGLMGTLEYIEGLGRKSEQKAEQKAK